VLMDDCEFFCVGNALELKETFFVYACIEKGVSWQRLFVSTQICTQTPPAGEAAV